MTAPVTRRIDVVRTYLELASLDKLRAAREPAEAARITRRPHITPAEYIEVYSSVGGPWHWRDRLAWSAENLQRYLDSPDVHVWTLHVGDDVAGFFELQRHHDDRAEIMYFGLATPFFGRGLGGWMLTRAVREAFALDVHRVILNTCTLDSPHALPNYLARGFAIVREEHYTLETAG